VVLLLVWTTTATAAGHPSDGYPAKPLPERYGTADYGYGPEYSVGDLVFTQDYPAPDSLSHEERYMLSGCVSGPQGWSLRPWREEVLMLVLAYYSQYETIPSRITPDVIAAVSADGAASEERLAIYRSPITGDFPALDAVDFEPGQVYCRLLTIGEMEHIASVDPSRRELWFGSQWINPKTREVEPATSVSPPLYLRVYGKNGTIYEGIHQIIVGSQ
jgi:hypothetical protein